MSEISTHNYGPQRREISRHNIILAEKTAGRKTGVVFSPLNGFGACISQRLNNLANGIRQIQFLKFFTRATIYLSSGLAKISNFPKRTPKIAFIF